MGVKRALAIISSHYVDINLEAVSDGSVVAEDDEKVEACPAETRRWEQKAKGELHGLPSPT